MLLWILSLTPWTAPAAAFLRMNRWALQAANALAVALLALLLVTCVYQKGRWDERADAAARAQKADAKLDLRQAQANAAAASNLTAASAAIAREQERKDRADDTLPDSRPSDVRFARYCVGLSASERAKVPRCAAAGGGAGTQAHR